QKRTGVAGAETLERELRQAVDLLLAARLANREQHRDRLGVESARDERERRHGLPVEPLDVVDETDERLLLRDFGEQGQQGKADEEALGGRPVRQAERA